jgi:hypothetical protein
MTAFIGTLPWAVYQATLALVLFFGITGILNLLHDALAERDGAGFMFAFLLLLCLLGLAVFSFFLIAHHFSLLATSLGVLLGLGLLLVYAFPRDRPA